MCKRNLILLVLTLNSIFAKKPNILFIAVDDLVPNLGCYNDFVSISPNIDHLASMGTTFLHAQCQWPVCGPSRASIMSGLRPESSGVMDLKTKWREANPKIVSLPQYLKKFGYFTTGTGKIYDYRCVENKQTMDEESWSEAFIFMPSNPRTDVARKASNAAKRPYKSLAVNNYDGPLTNFPDYRIVQKGIERMRERAESKQPFFLAVGFKKPHLPFLSPTKFWNLYKREGFKIQPYQQKSTHNSGFGYWKMSEIRTYQPIPRIGSGNSFPEDLQKKLIHGYYACVSWVDSLVGMLIQELETLGLQKNTIVILWGDHGFHLGDKGLWGKHTPFENASRTPLIIVDPRINNKNSKTESPAELTDIYPTLCELVGIPIPNSLEGVSLVSALKNKNVKPRKGAITLYKSKGAYGYSIRNERYRYIEWIDLKTKKVVGKDLFDYALDPYESENLAKNKDYLDILLKMTSILHEDTRGWKVLEKSLNQ